MKTLILIGMLALTMALVAPAAEAHIIVAYPDPTTGECTVKTVPGTDRVGHGFVSVYPCRAIHL